MQPDPLPPRRVSRHSVPDTEPPRLLARLPTVLRVTGLGRSTIYRLVAHGSFPRPVRVGLRAVAWRWSDLDQWSRSRSTDAR
jgi:prophage regulatory protein